MLAQADWQLVSEASQLNFVSVKAAHIAERHHLRMSRVQLPMMVKSLDCRSCQRAYRYRYSRQRMRDLFFKVAEFPTADFYTNVDVATATNLAIGEMSTSRSQAECACIEYLLTLKPSLPQ